MKIENCTKTVFQLKSQAFLFISLFNLIQYTQLSLFYLCQSKRCLSGLWLKCAPVIIRNLPVLAKSFRLLDPQIQLIFIKAT